MFTSFKYNLLILVCVGLPFITSAQIGDSLISRVPQDTSRSQLNMDAVYSRPFLAVGKSPVALGGYLEVNSLYSGEDGINEGLSFQARRLTMFMAASISKRIRFLTELEFEEGGREINIEFAAVDVAFHPALNFRGGIIMNPIGAFNQNHDGPKMGVCRTSRCSRSAITSNVVKSRIWILRVRCISLTGYWDMKHT